MALRPLARTLIVPVLGLSLSGLSSAPAAAEAPAPGKVVNINQAAAPELARLPRVGQKLADRIVAHRAQHGPFRRAEDLMEVKGVGEKLFASLKPYLAVSGPTTLTEKVASKGTRGGAAKAASRPSKSKSPTPHPKGV